MNFTPRQTELLNLLRSRPSGLRLCDLIDKFARSADSIKPDLHALRDAGLIGTSANGGSKVRWAAIEHLPKVAEAHRAVMTRPPTEAHRQAVAKYREKIRASRELEPQQTIKPAGTWTAETKTAASWIPL